MNDDLPPILPLVKPLEALRFFRAKGFRFSFAWQDVWQEEHARAFTVAKAMSIDVLQDMLMRRYIGDDAVVDVGRSGWRYFARGETGFSLTRLRKGVIAWTAKN